MKTARNLIGLIAAYKNSHLSMVTDSKMTEKTKWVLYLHMCTELSQKHYLLPTVKGEYSNTY